jgi:5'-nucleotidase
MNRRIFIKNMLAGTGGVVVAGSSLLAAGRNRQVTVTLLHTNDLHSQIEPFDAGHPRYAGRAGFARISYFVNQCRTENPNLLLLDTGDFSQGTPYFNYFGGEIVLKLMTKMGYDAGTIGNHEFDNGLEGLAESLRHAGFPLINSNYDFSGTLLEGKLSRFRIFNKSGVKIGIYGLGIKLSGLVNQKQSGDVRYNDPVETALEMEHFLAVEKKCDLVVCLSHLGLRYQGNQISDTRLAPLTSHTDVIIGGHSHSYLEDPLLFTNKEGRSVVVNHAHHGGLMVGRLDFVFEKERSLFPDLQNKKNQPL